MFNILKHITIFFALLFGVLSNGFANATVLDCVSDLRRDGSKISIEKSAVGCDVIKAWEAMISSSSLRVNIGKLESLSEQISKHAAKLDDFKVKFANTTEAGKQALINKVDVFFGFKPGKFSEDIVAIPQGSRPDPSTYLTPSYISEHLDKFNGGVTKILAQAPTGTVGPPGGTFILPKSYADDLISQANGSVSKLEELLGLDAGYLGSSPVRVNVNSPSGLRMPSGNELGANEFWIPGGKTSGGVLEATVDQIQPGTYTVNSVF